MAQVWSSSVIVKSSRTFVSSSNVDSVGGGVMAVVKTKINLTKRIDFKNSQAHLKAMRAKETGRQWNFAKIQMHEWL